MAPTLRRVLWVVVVVQAALAAGFAFELDAALELWPFGGGQLTHIFVGSIFAAAAASTAWCVLNSSTRSLTGIALDYIVILAPLAVYSFTLAAGGTEPRGRLAAFGVACVAVVAGGIALLRMTRRQPWRDPRPTPRLVLVSFAVFVVVLLFVSTSLLVRRSPLPWPVTDEQSTVIGLMFVGAAAYFVYGLARPFWENAGGQLAGFLAYDAVLIWPFLKRLPDVAPEFRLELWVYTAVVVYSAIVAIVYLALHPVTRARHRDVPAAIPARAA
jgi:hypothetical protein